MLQTFAERLVLGRLGIAQESKMFRRKSRDLVKHNARLFADRIAEVKIVFGHESEYIDSVGLINDFPRLTEKSVSAGKPYALARPRVKGVHVAGEFTGADAHEGDAVTVHGVHVGLDFKNKPGKKLMINRYQSPL